MDRRVFVEWMDEPHSFPLALYGQVPQIFCDSPSGHSETDDVRSHISSFNGVLQKLLPNSTEKMQPLDSFVIV